MTATSLLNRTVNYFTEKVHAPGSMQLFSILVYLWLAVHAASHFAVHSYLWGRTKVFYRHGYPDTFLENFFYQLVYDSERATMVYAVHILCSLLSIGAFNNVLVHGKNKGTTALWWIASVGVRLIAWASGLMLFYAAIEAFDGGMLLMLLMSFYCSVVNVNAKSPYGIALTNAARLACIAQVLLVYITAALYKLGGTQWLEGSALYYTMHIDLYDRLHLKNFFAAHIGITKALTWIGLAYQVFFPIVIWFRSIRKITLAIGIAFHLFIAMAIGLVGFGLAMMVCYILFWDFSSSKNSDK
jgi:Vitamin K-dependent gamma-carboxylase